MFSHAKFHVNEKYITYFLSSVSEDTGHTHLQQKSINYRNKTSVGPSKNTDGKDKEKKRKATAKRFALRAKAKTLLQSFLRYTQTQ